MFMNDQQVVAKRFPYKKRDTPPSINEQKDLQNLLKKQAAFFEHQTKKVLFNVPRHPLNARTIEYDNLSEARHVQHTLMSEKKFKAAIHSIIKCIADNYISTACATFLLNEMSNNTKQVHTLDVLSALYGANFLSLTPQSFLEICKFFFREEFNYFCELLELASNIDDGESALFRVAFNNTQAAIISFDEQYIGGTLIGIHSSVYPGCPVPIREIQPEGLTNSLPNPQQEEVLSEEEFYDKLCKAFRQFFIKNKQIRRTHGSLKLKTIREHINKNEPIPLATLNTYISHIFADIGNHPNMEISESFISSARKIKTDLQKNSTLDFQILENLSTHLNESIIPTQTKLQAYLPEVTATLLLKNFFAPIGDLLRAEQSEDASLIGLAHDMLSNKIGADNSYGEMPLKRGLEPSLRDQVEERIGKDKKLNNNPQGERRTTFLKTTLGKSPRTTKKHCADISYMDLNAEVNGSPNIQLARDTSDAMGNKCSKSDKEFKSLVYSEGHKQAFRILTSVVKLLDKPKKAILLRVNIKHQNRDFLVLIDIILLILLLANFFFSLLNNQFALIALLSPTSVLSIICMIIIFVSIFAIVRKRPEIRELIIPKYTEESKCTAANFDESKSKLIMEDSYNENERTMLINSSSESEFKVHSYDDIRVALERERKRYSIVSTPMELLAAISESYASPLAQEEKAIHTTQFDSSHLSQTSHKQYNIFEIPKATRHSTDRSGRSRAYAIHDIGQVPKQTSSDRADSESTSSDDQHTNALKLSLV